MNEGLSRPPANVFEATLVEATLVARTEKKVAAQRDESTEYPMNSTKSFWQREQESHQKTFEEKTSKVRTEYVAELTEQRW